MLWNNVELFNVEYIEEGESGTRVYRFPKETLPAFDLPWLEYSKWASALTTGCEMRFVGEGADIELCGVSEAGTVEIFRGDYLDRVVAVPKGEPVKIELRRGCQLDKCDMKTIEFAFSSDVWRVVFDHDFAVQIVSFSPIGEIRPPREDEVPRKKIICYGSSITHSAGALNYTNSYIYTVGRIIGADMLCKGMGGSCLIQGEVADYIERADWDGAILELGVNMVGHGLDVSVFRERAEYLIKCAVKREKPIFLISIFSCYHDFTYSVENKLNEEYIACLEELYEKYKSDKVFYIRGRDIVTDYRYLLSDLLHPSPFGHGEMGRKIAEFIKGKI